MEKNLNQAIYKTAKGLWKAFPLILGTILLVSLFSTIASPKLYTKIFTKNPILNSFIGSAIGSISAGNPIISYIFGGELLKQGISLIAVTAFLVAWVTVGVIQLPAESMLLGKKFAVIRNLTAFLLAIITAIITISILNLI